MACTAYTSKTTFAPSLLEYFRPVFVIIQGNAPAHVGVATAFWSYDYLRKPLRQEFFAFDSECCTTFFIVTATPPPHFSKKIEGLRQLASPGWPYGEESPILGHERIGLR